MRKKTTLERMADKFTVGDGCWLWTSELSKGGYGMTHTYIDGIRRRALAHRTLYEMLVGPIPAGLTLDHLCNTPSCVRPAHLRPATQRDNVLRSTTALAAINSRKTHCVNGHEFTPENTGRTYRGARRCRACEREYARRKRAAA